MAMLPVNFLGKPGMVRDVRPHLLASNALSSVLNVRMDNGSAHRILGHQEVYDPPQVDPYKLFWARASLGRFWVYNGLEQVYAHDGNSHNDITRTLSVPFNSGSVEPDVGDTLTGATSGATGVVDSVSLSSGTWAGGDAAGTLELHSETGTFNSSEDLNNTTDAANNVASTNGVSTGGFYSGTASDLWNGGVLSGILVVNNGVNVPQYWSNPSASQRLQNLVGWPSNYKAKVVRPYKNFLVALDIINASSDRFPYLVKWSDAAEPGSIPQSWDETDASKLAGEKDIGSDEGFLIDCLGLRDVNIVYKERSTWGMQLINPPDVFRFWRILPTSGMLAQDCGVTFRPGRHAVLTEDDFIVHDGQNAESAIDARDRKALFKQIDPDNYERTFLVHNRPFNEVWVCFPEVNESWCTKAFIWNYRENNWGVRELPNLADISPGVYNPSYDDTWDGGPDDTWDAGLDVPWDWFKYNNKEQRILGASPVDTKIYLFDEGTTFNGDPFYAYIQREGWAFEQLADGDDLTFNYDSWKFLRRLLPRIEADPGLEMDVRVGYQEHVAKSTQWTIVGTFEVGEEFDFDCTISGRLLAVDFSTTGSDHWKIDGLDFDIDDLGQF